ncbi:MAG: cytochrome B5 [Candidatus Thorarchaeota archaeon]|nr:MAG: cytochrome B5 [Candidatus Thorarchaeota archaeon]
MAVDRIITQEELRKHDGIRGSAWVAHEGVVYDVSKSFQWIRGKHQDAHLAGLDLTSELKDAPHGPEMVTKLPRVGRLG